jgi:hypothetical protein
LDRRSDDGGSLPFGRQSLSFYFQRIALPADLGTLGLQIVLQSRQILTCLGVGFHERFSRGRVLRRLLFNVFDLLFLPGGQLGVVLETARERHEKDHKTQDPAQMHVVDSIG